MNRLQILALILDYLCWLCLGLAIGLIVGGFFQ